MSSIHDRTKQRQEHLRSLSTNDVQRLLALREERLARILALEAPECIASDERVLIQEAKEELRLRLS